MRILRDGMTPKRQLPEPFWWLLYFVAGLWLEYALPGVDLLLAGYIVALQEGSLRRILWLLPALILIHEGSGSLAFGTAILWYLGASVFYYVGRWLFEAKNLLYILMLGLALGLWHHGLVLMMATLQDLAIDQERLWRESALQASLFPLAWAVTQFLRSRRGRDPLTAYAD